MGPQRLFHADEAVVLVNQATSRLSIPRYSHGVVVKQDFERSAAGYDTFVHWRLADGTERETWAPSAYLEPLQ